MSNQNIMRNENFYELQPDNFFMNNQSELKTPQKDQEFDSPNDAYNFYNEYERRIGFSIKIDYTNRHRVTKEITSRRLTCSKEGVRSSDKRDYLTANPRAETRTSCQGRMTISLHRATGQYRVSDFVPDHNHSLHVSTCAHMMRSQRKITLTQTIQIDLADDSGINPKATHELMGRQSGGIDSLGHTRVDHKNYLRDKREQSLKYGEAGTLMRYFQNQLLENPSFYYAIQIDCEEKITNIFWADAKMIIDYAHFGDVVTFDTTFGTNREYRPFGVFAGFNHHRETIIFGATLLYDEKIPSFEWLFKTFLKAHKQKRPHTIFTDQDAAMAHAISTEMARTRHGLCTWHIMQNGIGHLGNLFKEGNQFFKDFKKCMFNCEDETEFNEEWQSLLIRYDLSDNPWLHRMYKLKEKWAKAFMKTTFSIGMRSTQLSESLNSDLKDYLKANMDLKRFFKHFERVVNDKRYKELQAEFDCREKMPKVRMKKSPMLNQVALIYTPRIFDLFQEEYDEYQGTLIKSKNDLHPTHEYVISIFGKTRKYKVLSNAIEGTVSCSCRKFETFGILCCHALKVLDAMEIKLVPMKYIMKRWTRDARLENIQNCIGLLVESDSKLKVSEKYRILCPNFIKIVSRAAECDEAFAFLANEAPKLSQTVDDICKRFTKACQVDPENEIEDDMFKKAKGFKKKDKTKGGKRQKTWVEKQLNKKKVGSTQNNASVKATKVREQSLINSSNQFLPSQDFSHNHRIFSQSQAPQCHYSLPGKEMMQKDDCEKQCVDGYHQSYTDLLTNGVWPKNNYH